MYEKYLLQLEEAGKIHCFDNSVVSSLWISEFVSQLSVFSRRISFQLVKKPTEIKLVIISDNLRNLIDGISCCFK